ncbi:MAG: asparaginase [Alphaproteobacteria bacterium]|nr:asparaginase [Alphaproteobacteria bacterium SS10]
MATEYGPIQVHYTRGDTVESTHEVVAVRATTDGVQARWGDVSHPVFPRSAFKPFQALTVIALGAADAFDLQTHQLALAMASHNGEARHVEAVTAWLDQLSLTEQDLHCGSHIPMGTKATADVYRSGGEPTARHNNCSGKHTGMLALMKHLGAAPDYEDYDHPVQVKTREIAERFLDVDLGAAPWAADGCAVPNYAMHLSALAIGYARLNAPPDDMADACGRLLDAWAKRPDLIAGADRFDTAVMLATNSQILSKCGAEGVQAALIPSTGVALATKALDGGQRAAEQAMAELLANEGVLDLTDAELAKHWKPATRALTNARGDQIGRIEVVVAS